MHMHGILHRFESEIIRGAVSHAAFEAASGHRVISSFGASIGNAPDSIPSRFARGEKFDLVVLSEGGLEALMKEGKLVPGSRVRIESRDGAADAVAVSHADGTLTTIGTRAATKVLVRTD
mgnify:CR=1 FL=1